MSGRDVTSKRNGLSFAAGGPGKRKSDDFLTAGESDVLAHGVEAALHAALGLGVASHALVEAGDERNHRRDACADEGDGRALAGADLELVGDEEPDAHADRCLRYGHDAGHGKVLTKLGDG